MERMTTEQFFEQNFAVGTFEKPGGEAFRRLQHEIERLMQAYAEHLEASAWVTDGSLPPLIQGEDYSENVFAIVEGFSEIQVMNINYLMTGESREDMGFLWANCYGEIHGDGEIDGDYKIIAWRPLPTPPTK